MVVEYRWIVSPGLACNNRADPVVFQWIPALVQEELFNDIDFSFSVSALDEDEAPSARSAQIS